MSIITVQGLENFKKGIDKLYVNKDELTVSFENEMVNLENIFLHESSYIVNLFNKNTITPKKYVDNSGNILDSPRLAISDFIDVLPNEKYTICITFSTQGYYYDKDKNPICEIENNGQSNNNNKTITTPENAKYVRLNLYNSTSGNNKGNLNYFMFVKGENIPNKHIDFGANVSWLNNYSKKLINKKIVTFGDSITWYDNQTYVPNTTDSGTRCLGYQTYLRSCFGAEVENQGVSGNNTNQVCNRSKSFNYKDYELVTFLSGVNDFGQSRQVGEIKPIGSSFNESTLCGAYQSMIEDVIKRFPEIKIAIIIPYKVWNTQLGGLIKEEYINSIINIAKLYSIPYLNLYEESQLNELNKDFYFVDDKSKVPYQYHLNNKGYELISRLIVSFIDKII